MVISYFFLTKQFTTQLLQNCKKNISDLICFQKFLEINKVYWALSIDGLWQPWALCPMKVSSGSACQLVIHYQDQFRLLYKLIIIIINYTEPSFTYDTELGYYVGHGAQNMHCLYTIKSYQLHNRPSMLKNTFYKFQFSVVFMEPNSPIIMHPRVQSIQCPLKMARPKPIMQNTKLFHAQCMRMDSELYDSHSSLSSKPQPNQTRIDATLTCQSCNSYSIQIRRDPS